MSLIVSWFMLFIGVKLRTQTLRLFKKSCLLKHCKYPQWLNPRCNNLVSVFFGWALNSWRELVNNLCGDFQDPRAKESTGQINMPHHKHHDNKNMYSRGNLQGKNKGYINLPMTYTYHYLCILFPPPRILLPLHIYTPQGCLPCMYSLKLRSTLP